MLGTQTFPLYHNNPWLFFHKSGQLLFLDITFNLLDLLVFQLFFPNILVWSRIYFYLHDFHVSDNPKIELVEIFALLKLYIRYFRWTHMRPLTPSVSYHIHFFFGW
jgi:hypothetical protein